VATAPIRPLAWEPPYAAEAAQEIATTTTKDKKDKKKKKNNNNNDSENVNYSTVLKPCKICLLMNKS